MLNIKSLPVFIEDELLLESVDLHIPATGLSVLTGPNGSGKSSFLKNLISQLLSSQFIGRNCIGLMSPINFYEKTIPLSGQSFLNLYSSTKQLPSEFSDFKFLLEKNISKMSSGEFQALIFICQLCENKKIYFMDEPFSHLHKTWSRAFAEVIAKKSHAHSFFIISHHDEFQKIPHRHFFIKDKKLLEFHK